MMFTRQPSAPKYHIAPSDPRKPLKPVYLSKYEDVRALLAQKPDFVINPAYLNSASLPEKVNKVLLGETRYSLTPGAEKPLDNTNLVMAYFTKLTRDVVQREIIVIDKVRPIYQVDVTRESVASRRLQSVIETKLVQCRDPCNHEICCRILGFRRSYQVHGRLHSSVLGERDISAYH